MNNDIDFSVKKSDLIVLAVFIVVSVIAAILV